MRKTEVRIRKKVSLNRYLPPEDANRNKHTLLRTEFYHHVSSGRMTGNNETRDTATAISCKNVGGSFQLSQYQDGST